MGDFDAFTIATIVVLAIFLAAPIFFFSLLSRRLCFDKQLRHFFKQKRDDLSAAGSTGIPKPPAVMLSFKDVRYSVPIGKKQEKIILNGVSAYFAPGTLTAVMGPSGYVPSLASCPLLRTRSTDPLT